MYKQESFMHAEEMINWLNDKNITRSQIVSIIFNTGFLKYVVVYFI